MNNKGEVSIGMLIVILMGVVASIAMFGQIIDDQYKMTNKLTITNDSITYAAPVAGDSQINETFQMNVTKAQTGWRTSSCPLSSITLTNSSGTEYTETTDYVFTSATGNFTLKNTAKVNASIASDNLTYVSYTYCDEGYNKDSGSRGVIVLVTLFLTLGIAAFVLEKSGIVSLFGK